MADEKKRDEPYAVDIGVSTEKRGLSPQPPMQRMPTSNSPSVAAPLAHSPIPPILSYCGSSILMTVTNKYVLSGTDFNLNFFLLCVQVGHPTINELRHRHRR